MKVIIENKESEIVVQKSRFIANIFYIQSENETNEKLEYIRKKYYDAKHHCYAYVLANVNNEKTINLIAKSSDDGEPSGTAGHPMLDIINGTELINCICIVTRYFGGILLGTGGLVRAYSDAIKNGIANSKMAEIASGSEISFNVSYDDYGKIEKCINNYNQISDKESYKPIIELKKDFTDKISLNYIVNEKIFEKLVKELTNLTKGKVNIDNADKKVYYLNKNEIFYL